MIIVLRNKKGIMKKEILQFLHERIKKLKKEAFEYFENPQGDWKRGKHYGALEEARWIRDILRRKFLK